jgi:hypothetical protein
MSGARLSLVLVALVCALTSAAAAPRLACPCAGRLGLLLRAASLELGAQRNGTYPSSAKRTGSG